MDEKKTMALHLEAIMMMSSREQNHEKILAAENPFNQIFNGRSSRDKESSTVRLTLEKI